MRMKRTSISSGFLCNYQLTKNCVEVKRNKMWQVVLCQFRSALFYLCYFWAEWRHNPIVGSRRPGGGGTGRRPLTEPYHLRNFKKRISMPFQLDLVFIRMLLITDFVYQTGMKLRYRGKTAFSVVRIEPCATPNRTFARLDCLSIDLCKLSRVSHVAQEPKKSCLRQSNCI